MKEQMDKNLESVWKKTESIIERKSSRGFRCCALAFYNFATTALNAARELSNNAIRNTKSDKSAKKLYEYKKKNEKIAKSIIDIRNKVISHPENINSAASLSGWGSNCKLLAITRPLTYEIGIQKLYRLDPQTHLKWLYEYLNGLFEYLDECFDIQA